MKFYMEMTPCGLMVPKKKKIGPHSKQDMLATGDLGLSQRAKIVAMHGKSGVICSKLGECVESCFFLSC